MAGLTSIPTEILFQRFEKLYHKFNQPQNIFPDPLNFVLVFPDAKDQELAGVIASSLAYGQITQIHRSLTEVFHIIGTPTTFLRESDFILRQAFKHFKHRFTTGEDLSNLLIALKTFLQVHGSLHAYFVSGYINEEENYLNCLSRLIDELRTYMPGGDNFLLPNPKKGSAMKRLNLFLRWMIRKDAVDPGTWHDLPKEKLIVPLDVHIFRISKYLQFTSRSVADIRAALEITRAFLKVNPEDPVKYDFTLAQLGIRRGSKSTRVDNLLDL